MLPFPDMNFVPLDILTAAEQNMLVQNILSLSNGSGIGADAITARNINFASLTPIVTDSNGWADYGLFFVRRFNDTGDTNQVPSLNPWTAQTIDAPVGFDISNKSVFASRTNAGFAVIGFSSITANSIVLQQRNMAATAQARPAGIVNLMILK